MRAGPVADLHTAARHVNAIFTSGRQK